MAEMLKEREAIAAVLQDAKPVWRVCFVCTGNTCRSPMAEAVANVLLQMRGKGDEAFSRGLYANENEPISSGALAALQEAQIPPVEVHDYRKHTARNLREGEVEHFDLLVAMTPAHAMELMMRFPQAASKIVCMPCPISDPYGGDRATYAACLKQIQEGVHALLTDGGQHAD